MDVTAEMAIDTFRYSYSCALSYEVINPLVNISCN